MTKIKILHHLFPFVFLTLLPLRAAEEEAPVSVRQLIERAELILCDKVPDDLYIAGLEPLANLTLAEFQETAIGKSMGADHVAQEWNRLGFRENEHAASIIKQLVGLPHTKLFIFDEKVRRDYTVRFNESGKERAEERAALGLKKEILDKEDAIKVKEDAIKIKDLAIAKVNKAAFLDRAKTIKNLSDNIFSKRFLASLIALVAGFFGFKEFARYIFGSYKPQTVRFTNVPFTLLDRFLFLLKKPLDMKTEGVAKRRSFYNAHENKALAQFSKMARLWASGKKKRVPHLLLHGVSGVGKSLFVEKIARYSGAKVIKTSGAELGQLESEALKIQEIFFLFKKANTQKRCIIFIDEADQIGTKMLERINSLISENSGGRVMLVLITNKFGDIPESIKNRMGAIYHIKAPGREVVGRMLQHFLRRKKALITDITPLVDALVIRGFTQRMIAGFAAHYIKSGSTCAILLESLELHFRIEGVKPQMSQKPQEEPVPAKKPAGTSPFDLLLGLLLLLGLGGGIFFLRKRKTNPETHES